MKSLFTPLLATFRPVRAGEQAHLVVGSSAQDSRGEIPTELRARSLFRLASTRSASAFPLARRRRGSRDAAAPPQVSGEQIPPSLRNFDNCTLRPLVVPVPVPHWNKLGVGRRDARKTSVSPSGEVVAEVAGERVTCLCLNLSLS